VLITPCLACARLPEGPLRLHLLYVMDALLNRAHKALSAGGEAAAAAGAGGSGQDEVVLSLADAKELVAKAGYAAKLMVPKAAFDGDSIGKVRAAACAGGVGNVSTPGSAGMCDQGMQLLGWVLGYSEVSSCQAGLLVAVQCRLNGMAVC
jgi:hypothetical protein